MIRTHNAQGPVVGRRRTTLIFDPDDKLGIIPLYSRDSVITFFTEHGEIFATVKAELSEGRAMRTRASKLEAPYFRIGGYGKFADGRGQFKGIEGIISATGALSVTPPVVSTLYILRINDPHHRFRPLN